MTTTTWDPSNTGIFLTLTNSNGTVASTINSSWENTFSTTSKSAGQVYWEIALDDASNPAGLILGIGALAMGTLTFPGADANGEGYQSNNGNIYYSGSSAAGNPADPLNAGDVACFVLDYVNGVWGVRRNNGLWYGTGATFTPGVSGGTPIPPALSGGSLICAGLFSGTPTQCSLRTTSAQFSYSPPSGFVAWDAPAAVSATITTSLGGISQSASAAPSGDVANITTALIGIGQVAAGAPLTPGDTQFYSWWTVRP